MADSKDSAKGRGAGKVHDSTYYYMYWEDLTDAAAKSPDALKEWSERCMGNVVASTLARKRKEQGKTIAQVAKSAGISPNKTSRVLAWPGGDAANVKLGDFIKVCAVLDVTPDEAMGITESFGSGGPERSESIRILRRLTQPLELTPIRDILLALDRKQMLYTAVGTVESGIREKIETGEPITADAINEVLVRLSKKTSEIPFLHGVVG